MALENKRQVGGLENVEAVPRLVEQRPHVLVDADGVHEDQGHLARRQRVAITAGRFALAVVEVEQPSVRHLLEVPVEVRLDVVEDGARPGDEITGVPVRLEWGTPLRIHPQVPGPQPLHAKV